MRIVNLFAVVLLVMSSTILAMAEPMEIDLEYKTMSRDGENEYWAIGWQSIERIDHLPEGDWVLPDFVATKPFLGVITLGESQFYFALDTRKETSRFYDKLYMDLNCNRDLTDDPISSSDNVGGDGFYRRADFSEFDLEYQLDGKATPYRICFNANAFSPDGKEMTNDPETWINNTTIIARMTCYYRGEVRVNDKMMTFFLSDRDCNGRFNDVMGPSPGDIGLQGVQGDSIAISSGEQVSYNESMILGSHLAIGEDLFKITVDIPANRILLDPVREGFGFLDLAESTEWVMILSEQGSTSVVGYQPGKKLIVPPGAYRVTGYQLLRKDSNGGQWKLFAGASPKAVYTSVAANESARMQYAEPFTPVVSVPDYALQQFMQDASSPVSLEFALQGCAGEKVINLLRSEKDDEIVRAAGSSRPEKPTYKILKPDGEIAAQGNFEYG